MAETTKIKMAAIEAKQDIEIELSTRPALRLWQGREKTEKRHGIIGIPGFCKFMRIIEQSVREDDPYADFHYHKIELAIEELTYDLTSELKDIESFLQENTPAAMRLPDIGSKNPVVVPIRFASKLGFQLVYQLLKVDQVILKVLLANHIGLLPNKDKFETLARLERKVRSVLHLVFAFRHTGVTRDDMMTNNKKAQLAKEQMGELDAGYLEGTTRSSNAPPLPPKRLQTLGKLADPEADIPEAKAPFKYKLDETDEFAAELDRMLEIADAAQPLNSRKKVASA
jgi:integrating conjugative element protein (TIGR03761 family)